MATGAAAGVFVLVLVFSLWALELVFNAAWSWRQRRRWQ
jgi:hypothetical protein